MTIYSCRCGRAFTYMTLAVLCDETDHEIGAGPEADGTRRNGPAPVLLGGTVLAAAFLTASAAIDAVFA